MSEILTSQMTLEYREEWSAWEFVREVVQNTLDEVEALPEVTYEGDVTIFTDNGAGLTEGAFYLLGKTDGKDESKRGSKREGIKVGMVRMMALGSTIVARSRDWICTLSITEMFDEQIVQYSFEKTEEYFNGTQYHVTGLYMSEVNNWLATRFIDNSSEDVIFNSSKKGMILGGESAGKIYCKGIYVGEVPKKSKFGYNLLNLDLNTDRSYPNYYTLTSRIGELISLVQDEELISLIMDEMKKDTLESDAQWMNLNDTWKKVFYDKYGANAVPSDDSKLRGKVSYEGGKMVKFNADGFVSALQALGIIDAQGYIEQKYEERRETEYKFFDDINKKKQRNVKIAFGLVNKTGMFRNTFKSMVEAGSLRFFNSTLNDGRAFGERGGRNIFIPLDITHDPIEMFNTIVHELIHVEYSAEDLSEAMQRLQGEALKKLLTYAYRFMSPKVLIGEAEQ